MIDPRNGTSWELLRGWITHVEVAADCCSTLVLLPFYEHYGSAQIACQSVGHVLQTEALHLAEVG